MISFNEALETAKKNYPNVDSCTEYKDAYEFYSSNASESFGGEGSPIVIEKATGDALNFVVALGDGLLDEEIKELKVS